MKIRKLRLKNGYKRFFDLTIDLGEDPKRIVALVGPNGCGKSSVLDGMLFHNSAWNPIGNKGSKNHEYHSMNRVPDFDYQNVDIQFSGGNFQETRQERQKTGTENTIFSFRSPYRYNSNLKVTESRATSEIRLRRHCINSQPPPPLAH
ncbi:ATP-binding protein [Stutzerimonas sp. KH-1]|jgi:DNA repair exonuclease SbcCD ATPase subunit